MMVDNGGIHRFSNFHYTSSGTSPSPRLASKIARGRVDQRADERVVTVAFLDRLLKPDYAHALSIQLPIVPPPPPPPSPSLRDENSPSLPLPFGPDHRHDRRDLLHDRPPFQTVVSRELSFVPPMDGRAGQYPRGYRLHPVSWQ